VGRLTAEQNALAKMVERTLQQADGLHAVAVEVAAASGAEMLRLADRLATLETAEQRRGGAAEQRANDERAAAVMRAELDARLHAIDAALQHQEAHLVAAEVAAAAAGRDAASARAEEQRGRSAAARQVASPGR
jgi:hypothetical protein